MRLRWLPGRYAICRLEADAPLPEWMQLDASPLVSVTRTVDELSIVCDETTAPPDVRAERGYAALRVVGTLDFALVGMLARLTGALAEAGVPLLAISTFDTDILLVRADDADRAAAALHTVAEIEG